MKKFFTIIAIMATAAFLYNCSGPKKAIASKPVPLSYDTNVKAVIESSCAPCHIAGKGNKKPYDNYANVKTDIDDIIRRIEMNPADRGFMPFKHAKLSDSTIAIFKQWKTDGSLEK